MDSFALWKKNFLNKKDKSNKGEIDMPIHGLINTINASDSYFTTSSCSGRITLRIEPKSGLKKDVNFLFESHTTVTLKKIKLKAIPKQPLWFRFEPMILHITCRTLDDANTLLTTAQRFFKHSGIIAAKRKCALEIRGSEFIEAPVATDGKVIVSPDYIKTLVKEANKKLRVTHDKIAQLRRVLSR